MITTLRRFWKRLTHDALGPERARINEKIRWVAQSAKDTEEFKKRSELVAAELGPQSIPILPKLLHSEVSPPPELKAEWELPFGAWMSARQSAIFEVLYHLREASLPAVRKVAFGKYDWTTAKAICVLCRFAMEGIQTQSITAELVVALPDMEYETVLGSIHSMARLAAHRSDMADALLKLADDWDKDSHIEALEILQPLALHAPDVARKRLDPFLAVMRTGGRGTRDPILDGHAVERRTPEGKTYIAAISGNEYPAIADYHAIRAALLLHKLLPDSDEVMANLHDWQQNHPDEEVRKEISEHLAENGG
ncbi:MAG TPA: hypothetical protein VH518_15440 [Tepidisphaeraceae bacterium]|jgi:hypothetical protein